MNRREFLAAIALAPALPSPQPQLTLFSGSGTIPSTFDWWRNAPMVWPRDATEILKSMRQAREDRFFKEE